MFAKGEVGERGREKGERLTEELAKGEVKERGVEVGCFDWELVVSYEEAPWMKVVN